MRTGAAVLSGIAVLLAATPAAAVDCKFDGDVVQLAAEQLGAAQDIEKVGTGSCQVVGSAIMATAGAAALECRVFMLGRLATNSPWRVKEVKFAGDAFSYLVQPQGGSSVLTARLRISAPAGQTKAVQLMNITLSGTGSCPSGPGNLLRKQP